MDKPSTTKNTQKLNTKNKNQNPSKAVSQMNLMLMQTIQTCKNKNIIYKMIKTK